MWQDEYWRVRSKEGNDGILGPVMWTSWRERKKVSLNYSMMRRAILSSMCYKLQHSRGKDARKLERGCEYHQALQRIIEEGNREERMEPKDTPEQWNEQRFLKAKAASTPTSLLFHQCSLWCPDLLTVVSQGFSLWQWNNIPSIIINVTYQPDWQFRNNFRVVRTAERSFMHVVILKT